MSKLVKITGILAVAILAAAQAQATLAFSDDFNSYTAGANLSGQGPWTATAAAATPMQVTNVAAGDNAVRLGTSGQDEYAAFSSAVTPGDGNSFYYALDLSVISAQANGDYFIHTSNPAGTTSLFYERLYAKSSGAGFVLGLMETSGTGGVTNYGSTVLTLGTDYRVVVAQNFVAGALNDTFAVYVNPTDLSVATNNTAYLTKTWASASAETATYAAINLRQGTASGAPAVVVDNLAASTTFADVVPEPSSIALVGAGLLGLLAMRRRRS